MNKALLFFSLVLPLLFSQCTTRKVVLSYNPASGFYPVQPGPRQFQVKPFEDNRGQGEFDIGVIRTPVGTPLEYLQTNVPVGVAVTNGFAYGLEARNMLAPSGPAFLLSGEVMTFSTEQLVRPYATASIRVRLQDSQTGRTVFNKIYKADREATPFAGGQYAPDYLSDLASRVLQQIIDTALDDPAFRAAMYSR